MKRRHLLSLLAVATFVTTGTVALAQDNPAKLRVALLPDENAATIIQRIADL
jgi:ABC-type phosphate/phosphonate transport system substrate-binding protein